jgi:hypothetical protein
LTVLLSNEGQEIEMEIAGETSRLGLDLAANHDRRCGINAGIDLRQPSITSERRVPTARRQHFRASATQACLAGDSP